MSMQPAGGYLLGIDVGTTATKALLLHPELGIAAEASSPANLVSRAAGWAEEDPEEWWANVGIVCRACLARASLPASAVAAVGVSGMVPTLILLDSAGHVVRPSIQQNDARAFAEIDDFRSTARLDEAVLLRRTGSAITQQSIGPKLLWLRRHEPSAMARAAHVVGSYDYIVFRLTGRLSCERNWALESGLFDMEREEWDEQLLRLSTIDAGWLGEVHWASDVVGRVTSRAAEATGLARGTPVVAGSGDHIASAFAAGVSEPGDLLVKLGGAGDILLSVNERVVDPRLYLDYHVIPGKFYLNGCMAASGSIIKWFQRQFAPDCDYAQLDAEAEGIPAGAEGLVLLPYFLGEKTPINDPLARGTLFGLTLSHSRTHVYRAVLEGVAYGFLHHLEVMAERGLAPTNVTVTNGGAGSRLWRQITADVLGHPLREIVGHPGSSLGAAFVAGKGEGVFDAWSDIRRFVHTGGVVRPDPAAHARYRELFGIYRDIYTALQPSFARLSSVLRS